MRTEVIQYIRSKPNLHQFIREEPKWYRILSRNPHEIKRMEYEAKKYYKQTIPDRMEQFVNGIQMAQMMMSMFQVMNNQS